VGREGQDAIDDEYVVRDGVDGELGERDRLAGEQPRGDQEWKRVHVEGKRAIGRAGLVDVDRESTGSRAVDGDAAGTLRQQRRDELQRFRALAATPGPVAEQVLVRLEDHRVLGRLAPRWDRLAAELVGFSAQRL